MIKFLVLFLSLNLFECSSRIHISSNVNDVNNEISGPETPEISENTTRRRPSIISRLLSFVICGKDSVIIPDIYEGSPRHLNHLLELSELMEMDPFDPAQLRNQYVISEQRKAAVNGNDSLTNLPADLLYFILDFVPMKDLSKLRNVNRTSLVTYIAYSRYRFIKTLKSKIKSGFELLENSTRSADLLNQLRNPLARLQSAKTRINRNELMETPFRALSVPQEIMNGLGNELESATHLKQFIDSALVFYFHTDMLSFVDLLEAIAKGQIFNIENSLESINLTREELCHLACQRGAVCLVKTLLKSENQMTPVSIYSGSHISVVNGHFKLFKILLGHSDRDTLIQSKYLVGYLEEAVRKNRAEFVEFLFQAYPILSISETKCLKLCMRNKKPRIMQLILHHRNDRDFIHEFNSERSNILEYAAELNFTEAIEMICNYESGLSILRASPSPLRFAIGNDANDAVSLLISLMTRMGPLDQTYGQFQMTETLATALINSDIPALKLILAYLSSNSLKDFDHRIEQLGSSSNLVHFTIKQGMIEAFDVLLDHFEPSALDLVDHNGRNAFMVAAFFGKFDFAVKIARLRPVSIHGFDNEGNNSLHLLLSSDHPLELIKTFILTFKLNWVALNDAEVSAVDLFSRISNYFASEDRTQILRVISNYINK